MHGGLRSGSEIPDPEYGEHFRVYRALSHPLCVFSHRHDVDFVIFGKVPGGDGELRTGYGFGSSLVRPPKKKARPKQNPVDKSFEQQREACIELDSLNGDSFNLFADGSYKYSWMCEKSWDLKE